VEKRKWEAPWRMRRHRPAVDLEEAMAAVGACGEERGRREKGLCHCSGWRRTRGCCVVLCAHHGKRGAEEASWERMTSRTRMVRARVGGCAGTRIVSTHMARAYGSAKMPMERTDMASWMD